jgi:hypothetical protein
MRVFIYTWVLLGVLGFSTATRAWAQCSPNVNACDPTVTTFPFCFTPAQGQNGYVGVPYNQTIFVNVAKNFTVNGLTVILSKLVLKSVTNKPAGLNFSVNSGNPNDPVAFGSLDTLGVLTLPDTITDAAKVGLFGCVNVFGTPTQPNIGPGTANNDTVYMVVDVYIRLALTGNDINPNSLGQNINPLELVYKIPIKEAIEVSASPVQTEIVCGQQVALSATSTETGATFSWTPTTGLDNPNSGTPTASPLVTTTYTVIATSPAGDQGADTVRVIVNTDGIPTPVAVNDTVCAGERPALTVSGGTAYKWYASAQGTQATATGALYRPVISQTTTYYVSNAPGAGCESARVPVVAVVNPVTEATFTATPSVASGITTGTSVAFSAANAGAARYTWILNGGSLPTATPTLTQRFDQPGTQTLSLVVENTAGCRDTAQLVFEVRKGQDTTVSRNKGVTTLWRIYPNPVAGSRHVMLSGILADVELVALAWVTPLGQQYAVELPQLISIVEGVQVPVPSALSTGLAWLRIQTRNETYLYPVVF